MLSNKEHDDFLQGVTGSLLLEEVEEGNSYKQRLDELLMAFKGFESDNYILSDWESLLNDLLEFENHLSQFEMLPFLYGYIARAALNSQKFGLAIMYANAGIEACSKRDDDEGVRVGTQLLCDIALSVGDPVQALEFRKKAKPSFESNPDPIDELLQGLAQGKVKTDIDFIVNKRPKSFKFFDSEKGRKESAIRSAMKIMDASRSEAEKYWNFAINMDDK